MQTLLKPRLVPLLLLSAAFVLSIARPAAAAGDSTPPVIPYTIAGPKGPNGVYVGPTAVTWNVRDDESPITVRSSGCDITDLPDTLYNFVWCSATSAGGTTTIGFSYIKDATAPVITTPAAINLTGG